MSRYTTQHYEDVARILFGNRDATNISVIRNGTLMDAANDFADLFAADNPPECYVDGEHTGKCDGGCLRDGFDRARFLAACKNIDAQLTCICRPSVDVEEEGHANPCPVGKEDPSMHKAMK